VGDVLSFGPDKPPWRPPRWLILVGVTVLPAAALAVIAVVVLTNHRGAHPSTPAVATLTVQANPAAGLPCQPAGSGQSPTVAGPVAGLAIDRVGLVDGTLERCDRTALGGPWTVVVRRTDGSLGKHGAVVTFPVDAPSTGHAVQIGTATGLAGGGAVVWPVAGAHARVRGDLAEPELVAIAACTTAIAGRPTVDAPAGYSVVSTGPYRPPVIHEARYGSADVAEQQALGNGLTYTGVTSGGGFEDQLYAVGAASGVPVHNRPTVVSSVLGGNATLAWEPAPGMVAYVGYSGAELGDKAIAALQRLAARSRILSGTQWRSTGPAILDQLNEPG
jgi:hypothetical protein